MQEYKVVAPTRSFGGQPPGLNTISREQRTYKLEPCMQPKESAHIVYSMKLKEVESCLDRHIIPWLESGLVENVKHPSVKKIGQYLTLFLDDTTTL